MKNIAIMIRGQTREWESAKHSIFNAFDFLSATDNLVYFFTTWDESYQPLGVDISNFAKRDQKTVDPKAIEKSFAGRKLGELQVLNDKAARKMLGSFFHLPEMYELILFIRYASNLAKRRYEQKHGMIFDLVIEIRPDVFYLGARNYKQLVHSNLKDFEVHVHNSFARTAKTSVNPNHPNPYSNVASRYMDDILIAGTSFTMDVLANELHSTMAMRQREAFNASAHERIFDYLTSNRIQVINDGWRYVTDFAIVRPQVQEPAINFQSFKPETVESIKKNHLEYDKLRHSTMFMQPIIQNAPINFDPPTLVFPMAGSGKRFSDAGYTDPKPFIMVNGKPMISRVVESVGLQMTSPHIFIVRKEHMNDERRKLLDSLANDVTIIEIGATTSGAAKTVMWASRALLYNELIIVNSDQLFDWDPKKFLSKARQPGVDGAILCFNGQGPKWSYVRLEDERVTEVAEKKEISSIATAGLYYWRQGRDFRQSAYEMFKKELTVNGEYYVAPVYNEFCLNHQVIIDYVDGIEQLGTPEELEAYLAKTK
jgi:choline kinase